MPEFRFKAAGSDGQVIEGSIEAADRDGAARALQAQGRVPLRIDTATAGVTTAKAAQATVATAGAAPGGRGRFDSNAVDYFTLELATLLRAELPLGEALQTLADTAENPAMAARAALVHQSIRGGKALSEALADSGPEFDSFYCSMVRAGETGGALGLALEGLAGFRRRRREMRQALVSALLYPAILLVMAILAIIVLLAFVVPQFTQMFADAGHQLPLLTRIVAGLGDVVTNWWWLIVGVLAGAAFLVQRSWQTAAGRARRDGLLLRLPVVGGLTRKILAARFARTLATLLNNGVHLLPALDIASEIVNNATFVDALQTVRKRVREGAGLAGPLAESGVLPPLAVRLVRIGESSGRLEFMLMQLAEIYENDSQAALKRLFTLAEPIIIIVIALLVSIIILSVVLVILESNNLAF
jgi:general secretion pathway protein F